MRLASTPLLLAIDCQYGFITDHSRSVIPVIASLIAEWNSRGLPVLATRFVNPPDSPFRRLIGWNECESSPAIDIVSEIMPLISEGQVVTKNVYTFFSPEQIERVHSSGWTDIVITGIDTDGCVLKSSLDAFEAGLTPWIVTDATASHSGPRAYDAAVYIAGRTIGRGQIVTTADVVAALDAA